MSVQSNLINDNTEIVINIKGRFDFTAANDFRNSYRNHPVVQTYTLDMSNVEFMDSAAIGMLLLLNEHVAGKGKIKIIRSNEIVKKIILSAHIDRFIEIAA